MSPHAVCPDFPQLSTTTITITITTTASSSSSAAAAADAHPDSIPPAVVVSPPTPNLVCLTPRSTNSFHLPQKITRQVPPTTCDAASSSLLDSTQLELLELVNSGPSLPSPFSGQASRTKHTDTDTLPLRL
ncbi:hypothetical protein IAQ61_004401 [Plenodomus lingam]|uniref:uncharacterized protein n=1 Tax=Leptosphaeria maculans TaxID=5022 RepID=UPI00332B1767|nr:hypothetical protein IAQ61_004401 [Plenodomus lingam]